MSQAPPASAGPNATHSTTMVMRDSSNQPPTLPTHLKTDEIFSPITAPRPPLLSRWPEYSPALPMCADDPGHYRRAATIDNSNGNSIIALDLAIHLDHPTVSSSTNDPPPQTAMTNETSGGLCTICRSKTHTYYRPQMPLLNVIEQATTASDSSSHNAASSSSAIPTHLLPYVTLYDEQKRAVWSLASRNQHAFNFIAQNHQQQYHVSLITTTLSFQWINGQTYRWRVIPCSTGASYDLRCYYQDGKLVAEFLAGNRFIAWAHTAIENKTNPFRQPVASNTTHAKDSENNDQHDAHGSDRQNDLLNTFLLLSGLLLLDNIGSTVAMATHIDAEEDDTTSMTSSMYYADQGLVDAVPTSGRWYSVGSVKSIELDPGLMHCWWGIGCCWSWCPCCMPGGWCDRLRWGLLQRKRDDRQTNALSRSRQQRRRQGWSQQPPDQY
ncbi:hypothetical protein BX666DRAFT_1899021 [Dichotomocladium elegans]|nr:hypothetical protein BX666DRAFT_1899021 [Dichotomocladium elegans]